MLTEQFSTFQTILTGLNGTRTRRSGILGKDDVVVAISQSGETADTLASVQLAKKKGAFIYHAHEWMTALGALYICKHVPQMATVFTTHATTTGRSISGNGKQLYAYLPGYFGDQMAHELNVESKHSVEKTAAQQATAFTTVSEVTARECEQLLERKPLITPNGFEQNFVPRGSAFDASREAARRRLLKVASALTGERYGNDTMFIATSGRLEMRNKGIDVYLDALSSLRDTLGRMNSRRRRVVAMVLVPAWMKSPRADLVEAMRQGKPRRQFNPVITHNLHDPDSDPVYRRINALGFHNEAGDPVIVIDVPSYLTGDDGIFNMSYYDLLPGFDAAVFPSYYEPWGYTPLESAAFGVPTVTTDLAGFGCWVLEQFGHNPITSGVEVIHRTDSNYDETVQAVSAGLARLYMMGEKEAARLSRAARSTSKAASWDNFIKYYDEAYAQALSKADERRIQ